MANLKDIRKRISSVKSTQQITKAMKMVAASKLRKAQTAITKVRPYSLKLNEMMSQLTESIENLHKYPWYNQRPEEKVLLVAITSDTGLCGAYNSTVVKKAIDHIDKNYCNDEGECNVDLICIGKKGFDYLKNKNYNIIEKHFDLLGKINYTLVEEIATKIIDQYSEKEYDVVKFVYNQFKSAAVYNVTIEQFLPIAYEKPEDDIEEETGIKSLFLFEPSQEKIIDELIPKSLKVNFYRILLDANASEHGARMTAMENASENAEELLRELALTYNKERQAAITKELLEIVSGSNAISQE